VKYQDEFQRCLTYHHSQEYEKWLQVLAEATKTQTLILNHSIHNCALSALAIDNPLYSGWILKLKLSGFRTKRKWCVLKVRDELLCHG
jgi:hypothetical protein